MTPLFDEKEFDELSLKFGLWPEQQVELEYFIIKSILAHTRNVLEEVKHRYIGIAVDKWSEGWKRCAEDTNAKIDSLLKSPDRSPQ